MGRPSNKAKRREEIVLAMMQVMAEKGYEGASIQAIAKQAGLAPGLIHYHFKTKQEILLASVTQLANVLRQRYQYLSEAAHTPEERLCAFINARLSKGEGEDQQAVAAWVMIGAEAIRQAEVKSVYLSALQEQKTLLEKLLKDYYENTPKKDRPTKKQRDLKVAFITAFIEGSFSLSVTAKEIMPVNWAADELISFLLS